MTILNMKNIILTSEIGAVVVGERSILKQHPTHLPTVISDLIDNKARRDYQTINEGLSTLRYYINHGLDDFEGNLNELIQSLEHIKELKRN